MVKPSLTRLFGVFSFVAIALILVPFEYVSLMGMVKSLIRT